MLFLGALLQVLKNTMSSKAFHYLVRGHCHIGAPWFHFSLSSVSLLERHIFACILFMQKNGVRKN